MRRLLLSVAAALLPALVLWPGHGAANRTADFDAKDAIARPEGYREWVFVGSSLGLRYDEKAAKQSPEEHEYKNVYINPTAYREYQKTGKFPQGTVLVLETAVAEKKTEPGLQGSYQKEFTGLAAAVKDRERFDDEWAYFQFSEKAEKRAEKVRPAAKAACYDCHRKNGAEDNVFTQFYPVLRATRKK